MKGIENMAYGIVNYGCYVPRLRLKADEYARAWNGARASVSERAVADFDEDVLTMARESSKDALRGMHASALDVVSLASTSFPYAYRTNAGTLTTALGARDDVFCGEYAQSTRAGTEALIMTLSFLKAWDLQMGLVAAADSPRARVTDSPDSGYGSASASLVLGEEGLLAKIEGYACSVTEHLSGIFQPPDEPYVEDLGLTTYMREAVQGVLKSAVSRLLAKLGRKPADYDYVVCPEVQRAPRALLGMGFDWDQMAPVLVADRVGHAGACSPLLGLAAALDLAQPGARILVASIAFGAGSDALSIEVTEQGMERLPRLTPQLEDKEYVDYLTYLKIRQEMR